jgi:hypothetical protein
LKSWYSNAKTKEKTRKVEPFRVWLAKLTALQGSPHHLYLPRVLWRHATHGDVLRARYREQCGQDADDEDQDVTTVDCLEETGDEEGGEKDGQDKSRKEDNEEGDNDNEEEAGEGEASAAQARLLKHKYRLARDYFDELDKEEQNEVQKIWEADYQERRAAHDRMLQGGQLCNAEELSV